MRLFNALLCSSLLVACAEPDAADDADPRPACEEFLVAYCTTHASCNPPTWESECLTRAEAHCASWTGMPPADPPRCVALMRESDCASFSDELQACWDAYVTD